MRKELDGGGVELEACPAAQSAVLMETESPFRVLVLGDFSGRASRGLCRTGEQLAELTPLLIEHASFDQVLESVGPQLKLGPEIGLAFASLHDFHPDGLCRQAIFARLFSARRALLEAILRSGQGSPEAWSTQLAEIEKTLGDLMRSVLHHPAFQALEATWRGLGFLVERLQPDRRIQIYLMDLSKEELATDLSPAEPEQSVLYRAVAEPERLGCGGQAWSVIAGDYAFQPSLEDGRLLGRLARLAARAGAPFVSEFAAEPMAPEAEQTWRELRAMPEAAWVGLALPRFLLRLPYGERAEPVATFRFEEMSAPPRHAEYLWGNPCYACVYLLGRTFERWGWRMQPGLITEIEDIPMHVYEEEGQLKIKPCAELLLSETAIQEALGMGLMPLLSVPGQGVVRLARFQSIADPPGPLAGPWD